jgi:sugar/nucleoside kinase (ribokinase family)
MKNKSKKKTTLKDVISAAHKEGVKVSVSLEEKPQMPLHFPGDHPHVTYLLKESERLSGRANSWLAAKTPNPVTAGHAFEAGWAFALAAAHLRCFLNGELVDKPTMRGVEK